MYLILCVNMCITTTRAKCKHHGTRTKNQSNKQTNKNGEVILE